MPTLKERDKQFVKSKFEKELTGDVRLVVFTQEFECDYCSVNREIAEELASLSGKIRLEVYDFASDPEKAEKWGVDKIPAMLLFGSREYGVRYFGVPSGYEFTALLDDIVDVSRGSSRLSPETKRRVSELRSPLHIQVFVTPTCPYCPRAVRMAHQMAIESEYITADMVESIEFPQLASRYQVMAVPKIVVNDKVSFEGALPEPHFVDHVLLAAGSDRMASYR